MEREAILIDEAEELEELADDKFMFGDIEPPERTDLQEQDLVADNVGDVVKPEPLYDSDIELDELAA